MALSFSEGNGLYEVVSRCLPRQWRSYRDTNRIRTHNPCVMRQRAHVPVSGLAQSFHPAVNGYLPLNAQAQGGTSETRCSQMLGRKFLLSHNSVTHGLPLTRDKP